MTLPGPINPRIHRFRQAFALSVLLSSPTICAEFIVTDLGPGTPNDINGKGVIVGNSASGAFVHDGTNRIVLEVNASYWGSPGGPPPQHFTVATATAINDAGQIAGSILPLPAIPSTQTALITDGKGAGLLFSQAHTADGINATATGVGGQGTTFIYNGSSVIAAASAEIPKFYAINDSGLIVGSIAPGFGRDRAARFDAATGTPVLLDLTPVIEGLYGSQTDYESVASSVNNAGQIVGSTLYAGGAPIPHPSAAFIVSGGNSTNLGTLGGLNAAALDINNNGLVVGNSSLPDGTLHAFVFRKGSMTDLNTLIPNGGWVLASAKAINDRGQIVGTGSFNGEPRGFLLNPIDPNAPQPPSIVAQPSGGSFALGATTTLYATVTGTAPFTFEWQKNGKPLPGPFTNSLVLPSLRGTDSGTYRLIVTNAAGKATSNDVAVTVLDPLLATASYTVVEVNGEPGGRYRIESIDRAGSTAWKTLLDLTLTNSLQLVLDLESVTNRLRIYRASRLP